MATLRTDSAKWTDRTFHDSGMLCQDHSSPTVPHITSPTSSVRHSLIHVRLFIWILPKRFLNIDLVFAHDKGNAGSCWPCRTQQTHRRHTHRHTSSHRCNKQITQTNESVSSKTVFPSQPSVSAMMHYSQFHPAWKYENRNY